MHVEVRRNAHLDKWKLLVPSPSVFQCTPRPPESNKPQSIEAAEPVSPNSPITIASLHKNKNLADAKLPFLFKLHQMLDDVEKTGNEHIVSWMDNGRAFRVHIPKSFVKKIIPYYFNQSKYKSFQRQLHLYEFKRIPRGPEAGAYFHPKFVRGIKTLCMSMSPHKIKDRRTQPVGILARPTFPGTSFYASKTISEHIRNAFPYACENPSEWMNKINRMYVTGASLVAQLEEQRQQEDVDPLDGETVYSFGGMPFHYLESVPEEGKAPDSDGMSVDDM